MCRMAAIKSKTPVAPVLALAHDAGDAERPRQFRLCHGHARPGRRVCELQTVPLALHGLHLRGAGSRRRRSWKAWASRPSSTISRMWMYSPKLNFRRMPHYVFRNYRYPEAYNVLTRPAHARTKEAAGGNPAQTPRGAGPRRSRLRLFLLARRADAQRDRRPARHRHLLPVVERRPLAAGAHHLRAVPPEHQLPDRALRRPSLLPGRLHADGQRRKHLLPEEQGIPAAPAPGLPRL